MSNWDLRFSKKLVFRSPLLLDSPYIQTYRKSLGPLVVFQRSIPVKIFDYILPKNYGFYILSYTLIFRKYDLLKSKYFLLDILEGEKW